MKEEKVIALIFKREVTKEDDDYRTMIYKLVDVKKGIEVADGNNSEEFISEEDEHIPFIDDLDNMDSEYVYAFPDYISNLSEKQINESFEYAKEEAEEIKNYILFQIYSLGEEYVQTYSINPNNVDNFIDINPRNTDGIYEIESDKYDEVSSTKEYIKGSTKKENTNVLYADEIYEAVRKTVICQDEQIKSIASSIAKNSRITDPRLKDNLLICGPSGVGKSEIFRCISNIADIPITMEDSSEYTAAGYKGKDVTDILVHLYLNANKNIEKAQRGIVVIDEIDKKISKDENNEIYTKAVLDSLLKMAEGHTYHIEGFDIDTSFITFAMAGAFSGIEEYSKTKRSLGFMSEDETKETEKTTNQYTENTLLKYGLKPEFLGRNKLVVMNNLDIEDFCKIINESDKSHLQLYKYLFNDLGINFIYDDKTIEAIAKKAKELGVGARSIKKIIENAFEVINFQIFSKNNYKELIISPETIEDNTKFILR